MKNTTTKNKNKHLRGAKTMAFEPCNGPELPPASVLNYLVNPTSVESLRNINSNHVAFHFCPDLESTSILHDDNSVKPFSFDCQVNAGDKQSPPYTPCEYYMLDGDKCHTNIHIWKTLASLSKGQGINMNDANASLIPKIIEDLSATTSTPKLPSNANFKNSVGHSELGKTAFGKYYFHD